MLSCSYFFRLKYGVACQLCCPLVHDNSSSAHTAVQSSLLLREQAPSQAVTPPPHAACFLFPRVTVQPCHPAREKSSTLPLFLQSYRNYSLRLNSLGNCVDNCPVQMAEKNATFKIHSQKLYVIMVSSKYLGKLTLDSSIYSC